MSRIERLNADTAPAYRAAFRADPNATVYHSLAWRDFLRATVGGTPTWWVAWEGERPVAVLPYMTRSTALGPVINSMPWYGSHGGVHLLPGGTDAHRAALIEQFAAELEATKPLSCTVVLDPQQDEDAFELWSSALAPTALDERIGQSNTLPVQTDDPGAVILATARQKTRNLIRKSLKQGFEVAVSDGADAWDFLHATHAANMQAIGGTPKPRAHFEGLKALPEDMRRLYVASDHGVPVAALLVLRLGCQIEYLTPAIRVEWRSKQPLSRLIYAAMLDGARDGFRIWNWGGTWHSQRSLHHFKSGWGAVDRPYRYLICASREARDAIKATALEARSALCPYYYLYPYSAL